VDLAAFRILQESLTNVARHAGRATVRLSLTYGERDLLLTVEDDGHGAQRAAPAGGGNGIPGMRERATAVGGDFSAGQLPGGGFGVSARLPFGAGA
jgi:signal transduction histidine kinase